MLQLQLSSTHWSEWCEKSWGNTIVAGTKHICCTYLHPGCNIKTKHPPWWIVVGFGIAWHFWAYDFMILQFNLYCFKITNKEELKLTLCKSQVVAVQISVLVYHFSNAISIHPPTIGQWKYYGLVTIIQEQGMMPLCRIGVGLTLFPSTSLKVSATEWSATIRDRNWFDIPLLPWNGMDPCNPEVDMVSSAGSRHILVVVVVGGKAWNQRLNVNW